VHLAAFGREPEARLVDLLREEPGYGPSLVAETDGLATGHVLFSRATIACEDGRERAVANLAPVGVLPSDQRQGIGSRLIRRAMSDLTIPAIVLGHAD
jgi:putative acetyltransferase